MELRSPEHRPDPAGIACAFDRELRARVAGHAFGRHPFLARCRTGGLSRRDAARVVVQIDRVVRAMDHGLAALAIGAGDDGLRRAARELLRGWRGGGVPSEALCELVRRCTRALGLGDPAVDATPPLPATAALERVWRDLGRPPRPLAGFGAAAYALPGVAGLLVPAVGEGVDRACALPDDTLAFFSAARWPSCRDLAAALAAAVQSPAEVAELRGGVDATLSALWSLLDDLDAAVAPAPAVRAPVLDEPSGRLAR